MEPRSILSSLLLSTVLLMAACVDDRNGANGGNNNGKNGGNDNGNGVVAACIEGTKRYDPSLGEAASGILEGVEGIRIELWDDGTMIDVTFTDEDGNYSFCNLEAGDYRVVEVLPDTFDPTWLPVGPSEVTASVTAAGTTSVKFEEGDLRRMGFEDLKDLSFDLADYPGLVAVEVKSALTVADTETGCPNGGVLEETGQGVQPNPLVTIDTRSCEIMTITSTQDISYVKLFFGEQVGARVDFRNACFVSAEDYRDLPKSFVLDQLLMGILDLVDEEGIDLFGHPLFRYVTQTYLGVDEIETIVHLRDFLALDEDDDRVVLAQALLNLTANLLFRNIIDDDIALVGDDIQNVAEAGTLLLGLYADTLGWDFAALTMEQAAQVASLAALLEVTLFLSPVACEVDYNDNGDNNLE